jgi:hypothetical protein
VIIGTDPRLTTFVAAAVGKSASLKLAYQLKMLTFLPAFASKLLSDAKPSQGPPCVATPQARVPTGAGVVVVVVLATVVVLVTTGALLVVVVGFAVVLVADRGRLGLATVGDASASSRTVTTIPTPTAAAVRARYFAVPRVVRCFM